MYWYYPSTRLQQGVEGPALHPERAKKLLAEAVTPAASRVRVNPLVMTYALDGAGMVEAVALDWEKIGIKVRRVPGLQHFLPKNARGNQT